MLNIAASCLVITALLAYLNHRFIKECPRRSA